LWLLVGVVVVLETGQEAEPVGLELVLAFL
jgi:hypothetical protein